MGSSSFLFLPLGLLRHVGSRTSWCWAVPVCPDLCQTLWCKEGSLVRGMGRSKWEKAAQPKVLSCSLWKAFARSGCCSGVEATWDHLGSMSLKRNEGLLLSVCRAHRAVVALIPWLCPCRQSSCSSSFEHPVVQATFPLLRLPWSSGHVLSLAGCLSPCLQHWPFADGSKEILMEHWWLSVPSLRMGLQGGHWAGCEQAAHTLCNRFDLLAWIASASKISLGRALLLASCFWDESGHTLASGS